MGNVHGQLANRLSGLALGFYLAVGCIEMPDLYIPVAPPELYGPAVARYYIQPAPSGACSSWEELMW